MASKNTGYASLRFLNLSFPCFIHHNLSFFDLGLYFLVFPVIMARKFFIGVNLILAYLLRFYCLYIASICMC